MNAKKPSLFLIVYLSVLAFGILLAAVGAFVLHRWLFAFEESEAIHPATEAYERYFTSESLADAVRDGSVSCNEFEDLSHATAMLEEMMKGKELNFYSARVDEDGARYNVVLTDPNEVSEDGSVPSQKIATIHLTRKKAPLSFGFRGYEFSHLEMHLTSEKKVTASLPSDAKLYLGGKEVSDSYKVGESAHPHNAFLKNAASGITYFTYTVENFYLDPEISCVDASGKEMSLTKNEDGSVTAELNYSEELKNAYGSFVLAGMKEYAKWMQADAKIETVVPYFDTSSQFYRNTAANPWIYAWGEHDSYEFQNEVIEDFYAYDENTFSCHVSFDQVLHRFDRQDFVDRLDMIVFVRKVGGVYKIYDRIVQ